MIDFILEPSQYKKIADKWEQVDTIKIMDLQLDDARYTELLKQDHLEKDYIIGEPDNPTERGKALMILNNNVPNECLIYGKNLVISLATQFNANHHAFGRGPLFSAQAEKIKATETYNITKLDLSEVPESSVDRVGESKNHFTTLRVFMQWMEIEEIKGIEQFPWGLVEDLKFIFMGSYIRKLDMSKADFSAVKKLTKTFTFCEKLEELDISSITNPDVKFESTFDGCSRLKTIHISKEIQHLKDEIVATCNSLENLMVDGVNILTGKESTALNKESLLQTLYGPDIFKKINETNDWHGTFYIRHIKINKYNMTEEEFNNCINRNRALNIQVHKFNNLAILVYEDKAGSGVVNTAEIIAVDFNKQMLRDLFKNFPLDSIDIGDIDLRDFGEISSVDSTTTVIMNDTPTNNMYIEELNTGDVKINTEHKDGKLISTGRIASRD